MRRFFHLITVEILVCAFAMTACDHSDTTSGNGSPNGKRVSDFDVENCDNYDFSELYGISEARLYQENGSYKIEVRNQKLYCYSKGTHSESYLEGDTLNLSLVSEGIPASCMNTCDFIFDVSEEEASATTVLVGGKDLKLVTEYSREEKERTSKFTISTCKDHSADDVLTNSLYKETYAEREEIGKNLYQITIPNVSANCGMDAEKVTVNYDHKIDVASKTVTLVIDLKDSSPQANCVCNFDMSFKVNESYARADYVTLLGTTYRFEDK